MVKNPQVQIVVSVVASLVLVQSINSYVRFTTDGNYKFVSKYSACYANYLNNVLIYVEYISHKQLYILHFYNMILFYKYKYLTFLVISDELSQNRQKIASI